MSSIEILHFLSNDRYVFSVRDPKEDINQFLEDNPPETVIVAKRTRMASLMLLPDTNFSCNDGFIIINWIKKDIAALFKMSFVSTETYKNDVESYTYISLLSFLNFFISDFTVNYPDFDILTSKIDVTLHENN